MVGAALIDRRTERAALDDVLGMARGGRSGALVLRGEPGVDKTALLEWALEPAEGFRVLRAGGVESEAELPFAALHQLCRPVLDRLDRLPRPQRDALGAAFGLISGNAPESFLIGLAVLSLLSDAAHERPLLCVVDDAQWLDRESAQTLGFVARRLLAEPVAFLFGTRERMPELARLQELAIEGLPDQDARELLASVVRGPLDDRVRDRIVAETRGNPLALLELPRGLKPAELAVGFGASPHLPLSGRIEETFQRRVDELPADTQLLLLVAAADQLGEPAKVMRAARLLDVGADAAAPAAESGLLEIGTRVRYRHPHVRSAIYAAAPLDHRRAVHRALADASDRDRDPDRRAWHLAAATMDPDEGVAAELEHSAGRAQVCGGMVAAATFLERSAQLTPDPERQAMRLLQAAGAHLTSGASDRAQALLRRSVPHLVDPAARGLAMRMAGELRFLDGHGGETPALLVDAAHALSEVGALPARETLMEALEAAMWTGSLTSGTTMVDVAKAARSTPPPADDETTASLMLAGYTERLTTGYPEAVPWWRRAVEASEAPDSEPSLQTLGMLWNATGELFDLEAHDAVARRRVRTARATGALAMLPVALSCLAWNELLGGRVESGEALAAEAVEIAVATGMPSMPGAQEIMGLAMLAWRGEDEGARHYAGAVCAEAASRSQGLGIVLAEFCLTTLDLGLGRYDEARLHALAVFKDDPLYIGSIALADTVEATSRAGDAETAQAALARLTERARASGTPWALGLLARAGALLAGGEDAEALHLEALDQLGRAGAVIDLARAHLLYGEWLRRQRRRRDARSQLRIAHERFEATGAAAFARRARAELVATGEHARARVDETRDELTPQEQQIAQLAAEGESNAEIAAQLFSSPHTVAYHLRKVFA